MRIGVIGTGHIGRTLAQRFSEHGHDVKVANSRGPETVPTEVTETGAHPVTAAQAATDVEVLVLSVPLSALPSLAPVVASLPESATLIDTSNYYPQRDGQDLLPPGQVESEWVASQLGRPVVKAWNCIGSGSLARKGLPSGSSGRVALPVAADRPQDRERATVLMEDSGFDAYDAGPISQSWRQQPGNPCYCTDLTLDELPAALEAADAERAPRRRDLAVAVIQERMGDPRTNPDADWGTRLSRVLYQ